MASGKLGSAVCTAGTPTTVYTVPAGVTATANIRVINTNSTPVTVTVTIGAQPANSQDVFESNVTIPANGILADTAEVIGAGEKVIVTATGGSVVCRVSGFEGAQ